MRIAIAWTAWAALGSVGAAQAVVRVPAELAGADARAVDAWCAPLAARLAAAEPDARVESLAVAGRGEVTVRFARGTAAAARVRVAQVAREVDVGGAEPELSTDVSPHGHVVTLLVCDTGPAAAAQRLRRRIEVAPGARVAVEAPGGLAVVVEVEPARLAAHGLTVPALVRAVRDAGPLRDLDQLGGLAVGGLARLRDVAVIRHAMDTAAVGRFDGRLAAAIVVAAEREADRAALVRAVVAAAADPSAEVTALEPADLRRAVVVEIDWRGSLPATAEAAEHIASRLGGIEGVERVWLRVRGSAVDVGPELIRLPAAGRAVALLAPDAAAAAVLAALGPVEGARAHRGDAPGAIAVDVIGDARGAALAPLIAMLRAIEDVAAVTTDAHLVERRSRLVTDAAKCAAAAVAPEDVELVGQLAFGGVPLGEIGGRPLRLLPSEPPADWQAVTVATDSGAEVALGALATLRQESAPACMRRIGEQPAARVLVWPAVDGALHEKVVRAVAELGLPDGVVAQVRR